MSKIFIINGYAGSGKDTFVHMVASSCPRSKIANLHSSDKAKEALKLLGWSGLKTKEARRLLADLCVFGQDITIDLIHEALEGCPEVLFFHERNPERIALLLRIFPKASTIWVERQVSQEQKQEEDIWGMEDFNYDYYIRNNSTLEELLVTVTRFINNIIGGYLR